MPVKAMDDGLLEIDGGQDGADEDEKHPHDGADEACPEDEVLELVLEVLPGRTATSSSPRAASSLPEKVELRACTRPFPGHFSHAALHVSQKLQTGRRASRPARSRIAGYSCEKKLRSRRTHISKCSAASGG